tara:strand:- start:139 stop:537 length:399 start_codon:yes stop_codon:yes gene_type:complete
MNKKLTIASLFLLALIATGCTSGYESYDECYLKEVQKCTTECRPQARKFCKDEAGNHYTKAHRDSFLQAREESRIKKEANYLSMCNEYKKDENKKKDAYMAHWGEEQNEAWYEYEKSLAVEGCKSIGINIEE